MSKFVVYLLFLTTSRTWTKPQLTSSIVWDATLLIYFLFYFLYTKRPHQQELSVSALWTSLKYLLQLLLKSETPKQIIFSIILILFLTLFEFRLNITDSWHVFLVLFVILYAIKNILFYNIFFKELWSITRNLKMYR